MGWSPAQPGDHAWDDRLCHWAGHSVTWLPYVQELTFQWDFPPAVMFRMGIFGGAYFGGAAGKERLAMLPTQELREAAHPSHTNIRGRQCATVNRYGRPASLTRDWWLDRQLIFDLDPLGWVEWFCWYSFGRRVEGYDEWQIRRWAKFRERHGRMYAMRPTPGQAQALLHWSIDARRFENGP